jgi:hypothetical protein
MANIFVKHVLQKKKIKRNKYNWDAQNFDIVQRATKIILTRFFWLVFLLEILTTQQYFDRS